MESEDAIPALEIANVPIEEASTIKYTLAYNIRSSIQKPETDTCSHKKTFNWKCMNCGFPIANFQHPLDRGSNLVYFTINNKKDIELPELVRIYEGYEGVNVIEIREYMMMLIKKSLNKDYKLEKVPKMSKHLIRFLNHRHTLREKHSKRLKDKTLRFEGELESGNISQVGLINPNYYLITIRHDHNIQKDTRWFYFTVTNTTANSTIKFDIINLTLPHKLYQHKMPLWIHSRSLQKDKGVKWHRGGDNITYNVNAHPKEVGCYYTFSFSYRFGYNNDEVAFAYGRVYTYSRLYKLIVKTEDLLHRRIFGSADYRSFKSIPSDNFFPESKRIESKGILYQREEYARSGCGLPVYSIVVTGDMHSASIPIKERKYVIVVGRIHPYETSSSFALEGFWKFLFSKLPINHRRYTTSKDFNR